MARWLRQSTSVDVPIGPFLDSTDAVTAETALTITQPDIRLKKNGGAWAQKNAAQTLSHEENGWYEVTLDATDTNTLGLLQLAVHESGALPVWHEFQVVPANVWDSFFGADLLDVNVSQVGGSAELITTRLDATVSSRLASASYTAPLDAAGTRAAVGLASANLDTQLTAIDDAIDTEVAAILAAVDTEVAAIKAKTDSLTFTVAGQVDANMQSINDVTMTGNGQVGTEFSV
jgi:hypothetical protein